jgi:hypothetical protein
VGRSAPGETDERLLAAALRRDETMRLWQFIFIGISLAILYFSINWVFWLALLLIIVYIIYRAYRLIERWTTPKGHRIRHGMLRGHLEQEYGTHEGSKLYKEMVGELRKKGYR